MQRRAEGGNVAFMMIEVDGHIEPDHIRKVLRQAFISHPVLMAPLKMSVLTGRPYWRIPRNIADAASAAVDKTHVCFDLRDQPSWRKQLEHHCQGRYVTHWNLSEGPQISLEQYALPWNQSRFCLRWPHLLMDAAGAQWFLAELSRLGELDAAALESPADEYLRGISADHETVDPLMGWSFLKRLGLFRAGLTAQRRHSRFKVGTLFKTKPAEFKGLRFIYRGWKGREVEEIKVKAKSYMTRGPALYGRYLAICIIRALHRVFADLHIESDAYLITMPQNVSDFGQADMHSPKRPVPGNYLVSPTLWGRRDLVSDKRALGEDLDRQLKAYHENQTALMQWAVVWMASSSRASVYQWLMRLPLGLEALSSGFSHYGEISRPLRQLCGAPVTNLWGAGPMPLPPGWNPVFSRFDDKLNLTLTYPRPAISDSLAQRYADLIESEIFESS